MQLRKERNEKQQIRNNQVSPVHQNEIGHRQTSEVGTNTDELYDNGDVSIQQECDRERYEEPEHIRDNEVLPDQQNEINQRQTAKVGTYTDDLYDEGDVCLQQAYDRGHGEEQHIRNDRESPDQPNDSKPSSEEDKNEEDTSSRGDMSLSQECDNDEEQQIRNNQERVF